MGRRALGHASLRIVPLALLAALAMATAALTSTDKKMTGMVLGGSRADTEELWWHHAVVYQIYPRSFMDSTGDGIGDLKGITSKIQYLKDIGVTAVWLSPFYPSPQKDFGYDIKDFTDVDPTYGTLADFADLADTAHNLDMKVVVDLVPNHSSDEHPWFEKSVKKIDPYTDYYVWAKGPYNATSGRPDPPNNWMSHFRFSAWEYVEERGEYYLHQFAVGQPDLNYKSADLVEEMKNVFRFWMGKGVDGFRIDALPFLFENDTMADEPLNPSPPDGKDENDYDWYNHPYTMDDSRTYDMLHQWREVVDNYEDGKPRVMMTECYTTFDKTIEYYGTQDKLGAHFTFNFQLIQYTDASSNATKFKTAIDEWLNAMGSWRWPNWVIGNHDNKRVATRFPDMADGMNMISLSLPGTAMTYNGEELSMSDGFITWAQTKDPQAINAGPDKYSSNTRDPCRTPMQWDDTTSAGFSTNPVTWMPTNPNYWEINVANQQAMSKSHLSVYKDLTAARKTETMKKGDWATAVFSDDILAITRSLEGHETYITIVNVGSWDRTIKTSDLKTSNLKVYSAAVNSKFSKGDDAPAELTIRPKGGIILTSGTASKNISSRTSTAFWLFSLLMALLCLRM